MGKHDVIHKTGSTLRCTHSRRTDPRSRVAGTENFVKFDASFFDTCEWTDRQTDTHTDKPVGFCGQIAPPVPNASISRICGQNPRNDADATFLDPHMTVVDCCCSAGMLPVLTQHATIGGRLPEWQTSKCISSVSFVRIELNFLQYTGDTGTKNDGPKF